jgi:6-pyruvoyltetrahydropterin/6-carboxytetrahydropterin synthase
MYHVTVRDRVMIAHSFQGEIFGPAQQLHGATYVVEADFSAGELDSHGLVVDIGLAHKALASVLADLNYRNLDDIEAFRGINTTTEYLAGELWRRMRARIGAGELGQHRLHSLSITLRESDVAWASYAAPLH